MFYSSTLMKKAVRMEKKRAYIDNLYMLIILALLV